MRYEYRTVRIENQAPCIAEKILDTALNELAEEGWTLVTICPHQCKESQLCFLAIFQREKHVPFFNIKYPPVT